MMNEQSNFWNSGILYALVGAAVIVCIAYVRAKLKRRNIPEKIRQTDGKSTVTVMFPSDDFKLVASRFEGCYEALYCAVREGRGDVKSIIASWQKRVRLIEHNRLLTAYFSSEISGREDVEGMRRFAGLLLDNVLKCGISRDERKSVSLSGGLPRGYFMTDGKAYKADDVAKVVHPAWMLAGQVVETGLLDLVNNE